MRVPAHKAAVVHERCETCWERWGRELWRFSCVCSGHVKLTFQCPGTLARDVDPKSLPITPPKKTKSKSKRILAS